MTSAKEVWYALKESIFGDKETREKLLEIKKDIIKDFINHVKNENPNIEDLNEPLEKYLINNGSIEDIFQDIFRWCWLSLLLPESIDNLRKIKEKISSMQKVPTTEELSTLKSEILNIPLHTQKQQPSTTYQTNYTNTQNQTSHQTINYNYITASPEIIDQENKFIKSVYNRVSKQIWKDYKRWWISPTTWFDCSGLRYWAFKEEWINFSQRLTAHTFSDADVDLRKDQVKPWDFMFWDQKPWSKKKHDSIYHIEMIISKPYTKNWKNYVRTLWSSTDAKDDRGNYVGKWVQIREREMKDHRHYWRPTYYYQLAQHERTWSSDTLRAWTNKPSQDLENKVLST